MDAIDLSIFSSRMSALCDEMGAVLQRASFSPNIKDRLDFSCAVFDARGELCAQAAHIPVHLGSMAYAMKAIVETRDWQPGDMLIVNDPFLGGTHLPDVTLIAPVIFENELQGFVANRAHYADIGASAPGSMPISSSLAEEGYLIAPTLILRQGQLQQDFLDSLLAHMTNPAHALGDLRAQVSANELACRNLTELIQGMGTFHYQQAIVELNEYGCRIAEVALEGIPEGRYSFQDVMDDDGKGNNSIPIKVSVTIKRGSVLLDFSGSASQVSGNINCPLSVTAAAVYYVFRCLMPDYTPACAGSFAPITFTVPEGSLLNARRPAAVAAGNVETSTRVVDVVIGALAQAIPDQLAAASHGSMNNIAMGAREGASRWNYYETIGGGSGAHARSNGVSAIQTHMTNTLNTPIESLEIHFPLRVRKYSIRDNSGGAGKYRGGDGIVREFEFLAPTEITLITERRNTRPWGLLGGGDGKAGESWFNDKKLPAKTTIKANTGDRITIKTPGGGGYG